MNKTNKYKAKQSRLKKAEIVSAMAGAYGDAYDEGYHDGFQCGAHSVAEKKFNRLMEALEQTASNLGLNRKKIVDDPWDEALLEKS